MKALLTTKRAYVFVLAAAALALAAGVSYGAIPSSTGTVTGCVDAGGDLKLIDAEAGAVCAKNKQTLTWNQQGPSGPAGPAGPAGQDGEPGVDGQDGVGGREVIFAVSDIDSIAIKTVHAVCPSGKAPIGGGGRLLALNQDGGIDPPIEVSLQQSYPTGTGWFVRAAETVPSAVTEDWFLRAYVICAAAS